MALGLVKLHHVLPNRSCVTDGGHRLRAVWFARANGSVANLLSAMAALALISAFTIAARDGRGE